MKKPLLSIGMIFKNDIRCIERCLKSLAPLREAIPCELIMADTGSTDGSRKIAEQYADLLVDFAWVNDFAAARNAVMDRCTGEWYLTIDTDEWLEDIQELVSFLTGPEQKTYNMAMPFQRNYTNENFMEYIDNCVPRMGKRRGGKLRYIFPIHEVLCFTDAVKHKTQILEQTFLHHDGYMDRGDGSKKAKNERNMKLLRIEQEKHPNNLRTLCQCIESAVDDEEQRKYIALGLTAAETADAGDPYLPILYHTCLHQYTALHEHRAEEACFKKAKERCPDSWLLRVDGEAFAAIVAYQLDHYEEALEHLNNWEAALAELERNPKLDLAERMYASYSTRSPYMQNKLRAIALDCLAHLERFEEVLERLPRIPPEMLSQKNAMALLNVELKAAAALPVETAPWFCKFWDFAEEKAEQTDPQKQEEGKELLIYVQRNFRKLFPAGGEPLPAAAALLQMGDRAPGISAHIILSEGPEDVAREWNRVTEWEQIFPEAWLHTMELGLPFPAGFYRQPSEQLSRLAAALAQKPSQPRTALDWLTHSAPPETPAELTWQLDLVTAALRSWAWKEEPEIGQRLCALYGELSALYLDTIYNPDLLSEEDLSVLPGMQRFGWHYQQALAAWEHDNELGYIRALRAGLKEAPAMKEMVEFLIEHKPKTAAQRQLEELAEQVRAILARYPAGDPAVAAIRQSEIYQKVAHLVEPQEQSKP